MCAAVTVRLAFFSAAAIRQILSGTAGAVLISIFLLLPAVFMGNPQTMANITARVYVSVTLVGILSAGTSWNKLTASMRTFHVPALFIFTLDKMCIRDSGNYAHMIRTFRIFCRHRNRRVQSIFWGQTDMEEICFQGCWWEVRSVSMRRFFW